MLDELTKGTLLGLFAGLAPGPLLALVVSETVRHDVRSGIKVALAPLLTDVPIVLLALFAAGTLGSVDAVLGGISLVGGCFVVYLGIDGLRTQGIEVEAAAELSRSLLKGVLVNALSPHPYLFWFSVGAPTAIAAYREGFAGAVAFVGSFYVLLVGSKVTVAVLTGRSRGWLAGRAYKTVMRVLGLLLIVFAVFLFRDGARLLGWL